MTLSNTATRYGAVAKSLHWLTALLILTLIALGLVASDLPHDTAEELSRKAWVFSLHKTLGVTVFLVALLRISWAVLQPRPTPLHPDRRVESWLAGTVHWVLYAALVIMPLAGWIGHAAASGFAPIYWPFGQGLPLVPRNTEMEHLFLALHTVAGKVLIGAIVLHVAGAVKHHVIDRDATLLRMLPGQPALGPIPARRRHRAPLFTAITVCVAAIALGAWLGVAREGNGDRPQPAALAQVASDWDVREGEISITVVQFGSEVTGSFADWTAAIQFDETVPTDKAGTVSATISIPSLTLGSVTDQAMGPDFFDAATHPKAVFEADIHHDADGYLARGTLRIKGNDVPIALPFTLALTGDTAEMRGALTLDRRNFGIGDNLADEANLAFEVRLLITLRATRGDTEPLT